MRNFIIIILANITLEAAFPIVVVESGLAGLMIAPMNWMATIPAATQMASAALFAVPFSIGKAAPIVTRDQRNALGATAFCDADEADRP